MIKIDNIPVQDYATLYSRSCYGENYNQFFGKTIIFKESINMLETDKEYMLELAEELDDLRKIQDGQPIYLTHKERLALHILSDYIKDSTPNEIIRNKIKELKKENEKYFDENGFVPSYIQKLINNNNKIVVLEELLGDDNNEN